MDDILFLLINGCLLLSFVIFVLKRFRANRHKRKRTQTQANTPQHTGGSVYRKPPGNAKLVLHCQPAHFDGARHRIGDALNRESVLFSITRNPIHAVKPASAGSISAHYEDDAQSGSPVRGPGFVHSKTPPEIEE